MTDSPFAKSQSGGDYFKPAEHVNDLAIIFEFKKVLKDQPHSYEGVESKRDVAYADIACFRNSEDVANATPSLVKQNVAITNTVLVVDVERNDWLGKATVQTIRKDKRAYVYRDNATNLTPAAESAAIKWYTEREAAVAAVEPPGFDD